MVEPISALDILRSDRYIETMQTDLATPAQVAKALKDRGWTIRHRSKTGGRITSIYARPAGDRAGSREIRVADHPLGSTVYGETQGVWSVDIEIDGDLDETLENIAEEFEWAYPDESAF